MNNKYHDIFKKMWKVFNDVRRDNTDEGWRKCAEAAESICKQNDKMIEKIMLAVVAEAEDESKIEDLKEKSMRYREAAKAFTDAWTLYESLNESLNTNAINVYCKTNRGTFARKLSSAIYEDACDKHTVKGGFAKAAYSFYDKFKEGISESNQSKAYEEMESVIEKYPSYVLQMMDMYSELSRRGFPELIVA